MPSLEQDDLNYTPPVLNKTDKVGVLIRRDLLLTVGRVAIGGIMGAILAFGMGGIVATVLSGSIAGGLGAYSTSHICNMRRKQLAHFYKKEIAAKLGMSDPEQVDETHLQKMVEKGVGNPELQAAEDHYKKRRNFYFGVYAATAAIMAVALALTGGTGLIAWPILATGAAVFYNEAFHLVEKAGNMFFREHQAGSLTSAIEKIEKKADAGESISPVQIMSMLVSTHKNIATDIQVAYGKKFDDLNIAHKRIVLEKYEPQLHALAITRAIENGEIDARELAFIAYGQRSGADHHDKPRKVEAAPEQTKRPAFLNDILADDHTVKTVQHQPHPTLM